MIQRRQLETFLRINRISTAEFDEVIRTELTKVHWDEADIALALSLLRNKEEKQPDGEGTIAGPYPSMQLSPEAISSMLGVNVSFHNRELKTGDEEVLDGQPGRSALGVLLFALGIVALCAVGISWYFKLGPFSHFVW